MRQRSAGRVHLQLSGLSFRAGLVVTFVIAIGFLFFGRGDSVMFDRMRRAMNGATGPVYAFVSPPIASARNFVGSLFHVVDVYRENDRLKAENAALKAWQAQALSLQQKVVAYEALLQLPLSPDIQYRTGRVVDDPGGPFVRTFRVNLGTKSGVIEGQAVTDEHGLIGRIVAAGASASRILLITDLNSRIPVTIEPTIALRATLVAQADAAPILADLPASSGIAPGWRVFVPGKDGLVSGGTPVGEVQDVKGAIVSVKTEAQYTVAPDSRVAVAVGPPAVHGIMIGQNDSPPVVTYLPKDFHVAAGSRVVTSGSGGLLPPDIPIGEVTEIRADQVVVKPVSDLGSVTYVRVLDFASPDSKVPYSTKGPPILSGRGAQETSATPSREETANATPTLTPAPAPAPASGRLQ